MLSSDIPAGDVERIDCGTADWDQDEAFFRRLLGDLTDPIVPFGLQSLPWNDQGNDQASLELDKTLALRMRAVARTLGVTTASLCHVAWARVLAKASGSDDVVFGTVLYRRTQGGARAYSLLPMRISLSEASVRTSALRSQALLNDLRRHQEAPLELAQRCSGLVPPAPLFSALLNYCEHRSPEGNSDDASQNALGIPALYGDQGAGYPLSLSVESLGEDFRLAARAPAAVGAMRVCSFMHTALASLVDALRTDPSFPVHKLDVLPEAELRRVLHDWNQTRREFPADKCVHELFEKQVRERPDAPALVCQENELSYQELNRRANRLAHRLRELGVQPDSRVAICVERGFEMIVALLAVLKAGGAYVPLDPAYPAERLRFMLDDTAPLALLTQNHLQDRFSEATMPVLNLDAGAALCLGYPDSNITPDAIGLSPSHLAYVIYTSGSTGAPKGVMCEHRGVCNLATALARDFAVDPQSRVLQFASFSFDGCVAEVVSTLCAGASLFFGPHTKMLVGEALQEVVAQFAITHASLPPAVLTWMPEQAGLESVRTLALVGEALSGSLAGRWSKDRRLINGYGPTESTVCATLYQCQAGDSGDPPIGRPLANQRVYILDKHQEPAPIGVAGELYIGGVGVARGYQNRARLTAERFLPDPFASEPEARMYRTGDLGRWLPDGNIGFLGRNDFLVKVRGFRIELGEIESRLAEHPGVREAVVIAREDTPGDLRVVAYYTTADPHSSTEEGLDPEALRSHLSARLPEYMLPAAYVRLRSLPLTINGKVDRKALPLPTTVIHKPRHYEPPIGKTETALAEIWAEFLKLDPIGRRDNFFELGGHSLLAARMIARVRASFNTRTPLFSFIQTPTIAYLADLLAGNETHMAVVNRGSPKVIPLIWVAPETWQPHLTSYLSPDQPVFSFVLSQEELDSTAPQHRVEDLAAHLVKRIQELCPRDAYALTGFCQTSLLAYECAQQLRQLGYKIPLLIMGDALVPGYLQGLSFAERSRRRLERESFYLSAILRSRPSRWKKLFDQRIGGFRAMREQRMLEKYYRSGERETGSVQELYQALFLGHLSYVPAPYYGRVLYLQSGDRPQSSRGDAAASWDGLIEDLEIFESPGDHTSIFREPHVRATAERIQAALDEAQMDSMASSSHSSSYAVGVSHPTLI